MTVEELTEIFGLPQSTAHRTLVTSSRPAGWLAGWLRANRGGITRREIGGHAPAVRSAAPQAREGLKRFSDTTPTGPDEVALMALDVVRAARTGGAE